MEQLAPTALAELTSDLAQARLADFGYVFVPNALREVADEGRRRVEQELAHRGLLADEDGEVVSSGVDPAVVDPDDVLAAVDFTALLQDASVQALFERVLGGPARRFKSQALRFIPPGAETFLAAAHQDGAVIHTDFYTCWISLSDCLEDEGGLAVMPGSQKLGELAHVAHPTRISRKAKAALPCIDKAEQYGEFANAPYQIGDVVIFHPYTIHTGLPNRNPRGRVRLSVDTRFESAQAPASAESLITAGSLGQPSKNQM